MKTPEEIKKGLECCTPVWTGNHWKTCDPKCPYLGEGELLPGGAEQGCWRRATEA